MQADYPPLIQELIRQLRRMPGIGPRSAERIALWIVQKKDARASEIAQAISQTVLGIRPCVRCGFFSEFDQCVICSDTARDSASLCVVEQPTDILSIERTGIFRGLYHSLGGRLSPLDHIGPENLRIDSLERPRINPLITTGDNRCVRLVVLVSADDVVRACEDDTADARLMRRRQCVQRRRDVVLSHGFPRSFGRPIGGQIDHGVGLPECSLDRAQIGHVDDGVNPIVASQV